MGPGPMNTHTPCYSTIYSNGLQAAYVLNESCSLTGWMEAGERRDLGDCQTDRFTRAWGSFAGDNKVGGGTLLAQPQGRQPRIRGPVARQSLVQSYSPP
jgi:hypothetical protein